MSPRFALPFFAVVGLVAFFLVYYFVVIARQETALDKRSFRSLAAVSMQFRELVNTYRIVVEGAAKTPVNPTDEAQRGTHRATSATGSKRAPLSPASVRANNVSKSNARTKTAAEIFGFLSVQGSKITDVDDCHSSPDLQLLRSLPRSGTTANAVPGSTGYNIELASNGWCAHVPFGDALSPLIEKLVGEDFDDVVLADASGTVLYQTNHSGVVIDNVAALRLEPVDHVSSASKAPVKGSADLQAPTNAGPSSAASDGILRLGISSSVYISPLRGATYRVYTVPLRLTVPQPSVSHETAGARYILCGLLLQSHFTSKSRSLPLTVLAAVTLAVWLVVVGAWPVLKFLTMRRSESVTRWAGILYATSIVFMIILMNLLVIHLYYGFSDPKTDNNMEDLAKAIDDNVGSEVNHALKAMESVGKSSEVRDAPLQAHEIQLGCSDKSDGHDPEAKKDLLSTVGMQVSEYPYFRRLFVYDGQGFEHLRWTVDNQPPPTLRVCDRPYFLGVQRNDLWYLRGQKLSGPRFRIDPIYSKSTGEYLAAIAQPYTIEKAPKNSDTAVMVMASSMLSLIDPVLPPDYGFAIIDGSGKVLFHSDSTKNGRENFFDELEDSGPLRAAVLARRPAWLRENYLGRDYGLYVTPFTSIQRCPWSLLVFSNRDVLGDKALERTLLLAGPCLMYFLILVAGAYLLRLFFLRHNVVWPTAKMRGSYCHLALALTFVILLSYALFFQASPKEILLFAIIIPAGALGFSVLRMMSRFREILWIAGTLGILALLKFIFAGVFQGGSWTRSDFLTLFLISACFFSLGAETFVSYFDNLRKPSLATSYSLGCFALLILVAGMPCVGLFRFAYDWDERMAARRQQLLTLVALHHREDRVVGQYFHVKISAEHRPFADDLGKWLFLRRRLQEQKLDLYDKAFRDQQGGQVILEQNGGRWPRWWIRFASDWVPRRSDSLAGVVSDDCKERSTWHWSDAGLNRVRIQLLYQDGRDPCKDDGAEHTTKIASANNEEPSSPKNDEPSSPETLALRQLALQDPSFLVQDLTYHVAALQPWDFARLTTLPFVMLLIAIFYSLRSTITKMFLLNWHEPIVWNRTTMPEAIARKGNRVLVGLPRSGKTEFLVANGGSVAAIDVATAYKRMQPPAMPVQQSVALDHFERATSHPTAMHWALELLEKLIAAKKTILIVTTIDPTFYLKNPPEKPSLETKPASSSEADGDRWDWVLGKFETLRLTPAIPPDTTKNYYQLLWSTCTRWEKIAIYPLAKDGWPNHKNHQALHHLLNRGLIEIDSEIHLTDPDFADYIRGEATEEDRKLWRIHDTSGIWDTWRTTLIVLLLGGLATILFLSQKDILGIISAVGGALTAATRLISDLRKPQIGAEKNKAEVA